MLKQDGKQQDNLRAEESNIWNDHTLLCPNCVVPKHNTNRTSVETINADFKRNTGENGQFFDALTL